VLLMLLLLLPPPLLLLLLLLLPLLLLLRYQSLYIMAIPSCCFSLTFWVFKCQHVKMVNFPRQARDKHRENAFEKAVIIIRLLWLPLLAAFPLLVFVYQNDHFTKTGSGQT